MLRVNRKKQLKALAMEKIHQLIYSSDSTVPMEFGPVINEFADKFLEDESIFEHLNEAYRQKLASLDLFSQGIDISYKKEHYVHTITYLNQQFSLDDATYVKFLSSSIEIMREVLPLGSVVELDPNFFKPDPSSSKPVKVVIKGRFIAPKGYQSYFPYAGVVYPLGEIKKDTVIYFTYPLIKSVVHVGFKDEMEESFELLMKKEMIVDKGMKSIEFSSEDMKKLQSEMNPEVKAGER